MKKLSRRKAAWTATKWYNVVCASLHLVKNQLPNSVPIFSLARSSFDNGYRIIAFVCERINRIETEIDRHRVGAQSIITPSFVLYHTGRREVIYSNGGKLGFANRYNSLRRMLGLRLLIVKGSAAKRAKKSRFNGYSRRTGRATADRDGSGKWVQNSAPPSAREMFSS